MIFSIAGKVPQIHPTAFVAPTAVIIGDVILEENTSVWFGCVLRGDEGTIRIGAGSNVQDNTIMHESVDLGRNCVVGHLAIVHDAVVGDNCLIGLASVIFGGAKVGEGSLVGAGALVTGGEIPPNSLAVGVPAKVVREVRDRDREYHARLIRDYQGFRTSYLQELEPVDEAAKLIWARLRA